MPNLSGSLDFALSMVCLFIAFWAARKGNDFLLHGFLWVTAAAFAGAFNLGGFTQVDPTHHYLSQVSTGVGTLAMGLGVLAGTFGPLSGSRWMAPVLSIFGAGAIHFLSTWPQLGLLNLVLGSTLLISLLVLAIQSFRRGQSGNAICALVPIVILLVVGFAMPQIKLRADSAIQRVDILHLLLITSYSFLWCSVRSATGRLTAKL